MGYEVQPNQTLMDVALMTTGSLENFFAIAAANGLSVSDDVEAGVIIAIPAGLATDVNAMAYISANGVVIATRGNMPAAGGRDHSDDYDPDDYS